MKKIMTITAICFLTVSAFGQKKSLQEKTREEYLKSAKAYKTAGWILIGGGTVAVIAGASISANAPKKPDGTGLAVTGLGLLSGLIGLPLLISADNMKKKANRLELTGNKFLLPNPNKATITWQPALKLTLQIK